MIAEVSAEIVKSMKSWQRNKILTAMTFFPPLVLSFLFIQAFNLSGGGLALCVVNEDSGEWTDRLLHSLDCKEGTIPYFEIISTSESEALALFEQRKTFVIIYIPNGFNVNLSSGLPATITAKINTIHEDISKNLRLGLEGRIYHFINEYQLETGIRPGLIIDKQLVHEEELSRSDYMLAGIMVFTIMWVSIATGGILATEEKERGTIVEVEMVRNGVIYSKLGKIVASLIISTLMVILFTIINYLLYGMEFDGLSGLLTFFAVHLSLSLTFATIGVLIGYKTGDIRTVPAPSIIICVTLWVIGGAINPLEFSAGSEIFKLLPSAAAIRIFVVAFFGRSIEYLLDSMLVIIAWTLITTILLITVTLKSLKSK